MSKTLYRKTLRFLIDDSGPTAVEYAVMLAAILLVVLGAVTVVGTSTSGSLSDSSNKIEQAMQ